MSGKELWLPWMKSLAEDDQLLDRLAQKPCYFKEQWLHIVKKLVHDL